MRCRWFFGCLAPIGLRAVPKSLSTHAAALLSLCVVACIGTTVDAKEEIWRQDGAAAFGRGKKESVVISDTGVVRLAPLISKQGDIAVDRVWDLVVAPDGAIYAASGDQGKVLKRNGQGAWETLYQGDDTQIFSLALGGDGRLFAGTGPHGRVIEIELNGNTRTARSISSDVKYVWSLAVAPDGALYAATGPNGQLWKRSKRAEAAWELVFDSPQPHLLSLAIDARGNVFAGSDGAGLVYEISPEGRAAVVLDAPQDEIRVLRFGPDNALYAGTATPAGGSPNAPRTSDRIDSGRRVAIRKISWRSAPQLAQDDAGTARLKGGPPGENVVYRIDGQGVAREIFRAKVVIHSLAWQRDRLIVGTGPEGQIFELRPVARESTLLAKLDVAHVLALVCDGETRPVLVGTGDLGGVFALGPELSTEGRFESEVFDTKLASRFGSLFWRGETPDGTSLSLAVRTGNVSTVDDTWSPWQTVAVNGGVANVPPNRFVQYRATLTIADKSSSPSLRSVSLAYRTVNLPPEIASVAVPDVSAGDGATRRTKLDLKWEASDPNDDELEFSLWIRKDDWPDWLRLGGDLPLSERQFSFDTTTMPAGTYRIKVVASDRRSNPAAEVLVRERQSEPFLVDLLPPLVKLSFVEGRVTCMVADDFTRLVKAEYSLDGGPWNPVFPDDGLFDTRHEAITLPLDRLGTGTHVVVVRATDAAGNVGAGDLVFKAL